MAADLHFVEKAIVDDDEIPAWKRLDIVCRKWAILSQHEKEQEMYQKLKEMNDSF